MMFPAVRAMCFGFLLLGTAACAGDFGRPRYPWLQAMADKAAGPIEQRAGAPVSEFRLTDEEKQLRKFAENLLAPPFEREPW
jgi:hypothetical protein